MTEVSARDLKPGDKTPGGLTVVDISHVHDTVFVTWKRTKPLEAFYHSSQPIEIQQQEEPNMAQRVNIETLSDLSGKPDATTVEFALDGQAYTIDLTDDEAADFRSVLAEYVGAAAPLKGGRKSRKSNAPSGPAPRVIREWAKDAGLDVPDRGRIPDEVREAYAQAN